LRHHLGGRSYAGLIDAAHALRHGWLEFWYQPKIDLCCQEVIGVEMFARADHPFHGLLPASRFLAGADEQSLCHIGLHSIASALRASATLVKDGARLPITINVPVTVVHNLPTELILERKPETDWTILIFDIIEEEILSDVPALSRITDGLAQCGMKLAADGFGKALRTLIQSANPSEIDDEIAELSTRLRELKNASICELKLDRNLTSNCARDPQRAAMCRMVIELIHDIGSRAAAVGIESAADLVALRAMGCDVGQGNLFGQPMKLEQLGSLLTRRTTNQKWSSASDLG
jgi:EAL domain-containing protein (putative c-di-GMP-specific phosphodiesterase class I)